MNKILVIIGPTSSGKSELAVKLARRFQGEIISCDSRQIYKGLNLGTGKVPGKWVVSKKAGNKFYQYKGVAHYLIDSASPKRQFSAALFQRQAKKIISGIAGRGKLPILCGGTGHWIDSVVYNLSLPNVKPNLKLRSRLAKQSAGQLFHQLKKLDALRAKTIDRQNKRRLIRALEIIFATKKPIPPLSKNLNKPAYQTLWLGLKLPRKALYKKIDRRLKQRINQGLIREVKRLHRQGLSLKRLHSFGLEYRYITLYLQKKLARDDLFTRLSLAIKHYSKRQITWWKRNKEIIWIKPNLKKAEKLIKDFLSDTYITV